MQFINLESATFLRNKLYSGLAITENDGINFRKYEHNATKLRTSLGFRGTFGQPVFRPLV